MAISSPAVVSSLGVFSLLGRGVFVDSDRFCIVRGASVQEKW